VAKNILDNWEVTSKFFVKVMPTDYKKVLQERKNKERKKIEKSRLKQTKKSPRS
jgi:glutamate synthase domain-containing protein 3